MLVFFIHGVATSSTKYASDLENLIRNEFIERRQPLPSFHSSFWANVLKDTSKIRNYLHEDLQIIKNQNPNADIQDILRYQQFRHGFLSEFVGDAFTYLNPERGAKIREIIADQLCDLIAKNPQETEIHIVGHSLGSIILWDVLFSDRFDFTDSAFRIREMIRGSNSSIETNKIILKSVTTIGSPILLFNMMLGITTDQIKIFTDQYKEKPLRWLNIIHSSDIIAYPLRSSLNIDRSWNISLEDKYIQTDANAAEKAVRKFAKFADKIVGKFSEFSETIRAAIDHAPMVVGVGDAHTWYWKCNKTASLITDNILDSKILDLNPIINQVITRIEQVDGMTENLIKEGYLSSLDDTLAELKFKDGSGTLLLQENPLKIHHVYLFDANNDCQFAGYVGWIHRNSLKKEVKSIKKDFC